MKRTRLKLQQMTSGSVILTGLDDIIYFEDHLAYLRSQEQLLLFAAQCLEDILCPHVICAHIIAVNAKVWVAL